MSGRELLTPGDEARRPLPGRSRVSWTLIVAALSLGVQGIAPGSAGAQSPKLGPNEIQSGYRDVLSILASGDREGALDALYRFETLVVGEDRPWKRVEDFWRLKLRTLREMLDADSLDLLRPVMMLHHDASQMYLERQRPFLAGHSRIMSVELAEIYADRVNSSPAKEFAGWVMTSLGAALWHPSSVISSADIFFRAQRVDPGNSMALMGLGAAYERNARYERARDYFSRLLELEPDNLEAALHLALCQLRADEAMRETGLATLIGLQEPQAPDWIRSIAFQEAARAQIAAEDLDAAEATIRRGLEALPRDQQLTMQLALLLDSKRRSKEALRILQRIEPGDGQQASSRLTYDVWEPMDMQDIQRRLWKDAESALPILAEKLAARTTTGWGE